VASFTLANKKGENEENSIRVRQRKGRQKLEYEEGILTSFLSKGVKKGSLTLSPETMVNIGSRQLKIAPKISILPSLGSTGSIDRCFPENDKHVKQ
jgi:hypothetical protein